MTMLCNYQCDMGHSFDELSVSLDCWLHNRVMAANKQESCHVSTINMKAVRARLFKALLASRARYEVNMLSVLPLYNPKH